MPSSLARQLTTVRPARSRGSVHDLNRLGSWLGAMAQSNGDQGPDDTPIESDLETAAYLGQRVADTVRRIRPGSFDSHSIFLANGASL